MYGAAAVPDSATIVAASAARTHDAVVDLLTERGVPVRRSGRDAGLISSDIMAAPTPRDSGDSARYAVCTPDTQRPRYVLLTTVVSPLPDDRTRSTVRTRAAWINPPAECLTRGTFEREFDSLVKARAESHR
jgi:hypothetical protein